MPSGLEYGENSDKISPCLASLEKSSLLLAGYILSIPDPKSATAYPPASSAPVSIAASIPCAIPFTATAPRTAALYPIL